MRRILVTIDGGESGERVARFVNRFFEDTDTEIIALNVDQTAGGWTAYPVAMGTPFPWTPVALPPVAVVDHPDAADAAMANGVATIRRTGLVDDEDVVDIGDPSEVIRRTAVERDVDLIVIGSSHKGVLDRLLTGSVVKDLAAESPRPVLVVH